MSKIIMHIDLNAFFATAEEIRDPSLVGKPVIVGGYGSRSVVSTCNYKAREYGVHSAMPIYQARQLCPNGIYLPGDYHYYSMLSRSFFAYLSNYSSIIEKASIDEGFVDMTKALKGVEDPVAFLTELQQGLLDQIGLKCSIGIAPTKFLAKMASDMKKPMGLTIIRRKDIKKMLYPLKIEDFFGIGKKTAPRLRAIGIATIGDLAKRIDENDPVVERMFGSMYPSIVENIRGYGNDVVDTEPWDPKSCGHSETFAYDTDDIDEIESKLQELAKWVSIDCKKDGKKGKTVQLVVREAGFKTHNKSVSLREPSNEFEDIYNTAVDLYEKYYSKMNVRLVGVTLQNLFNPKDEDIQMSLFNYEQYEKEDETRLLINDLNRKMKKTALIRAKEAKKDGNNRH
ncbi:MAG: DNA polymerase IV [Bacilli bacterium]|nr:DNA polymerase IV [Bacilli bacterium]